MLLNKLQIIATTAIAKLINGNVSERESHYVFNVKLSESEAELVRATIDNGFFNFLECIDVSVSRTMIIFKASYHDFYSLNDLKMYFSQLCIEQELCLFDLDYLHVDIKGLVLNQMLESDIKDQRLDAILESREPYRFKRIENGHKTTFSVDTGKRDRLQFTDYSNEKVFKILKFAEKNRLL